MRTIMQMLLVWMCGWGGSAAAGLGAARRRDASAAYASSLAREYEPYVFAAVPLHAPVPVLHVLSPAPLSVPGPARAAPPAPRPRSPVRHTPYTRPYEARPYFDQPVFDEPRPYAESRPYPEIRPYRARPYVETRPYGNSWPHPEAVDYEESASPLVRTVARPREVAAPEVDAYAVQVFPRVSYTQPPPAPAPAASLEEYASQEAPAVLYARPSLSGGYTYRKVANKNAPPKKTSAAKEQQPMVVKIHKHKIIKS